MAAIQICVFNQSTVLTDADIAPAIPALNKQVVQDFKPVWGVDAEVKFAAGGKPTAGTWQVGIFDNSDQAGALGYHDLTQDGLPLGKVFAATDKQYGSAWTVTASHEILEMLGDPDINLCASVPFERTMRFYAYEVCDACEDDPYGYKIDGVLVSDFVFPSWFQYFRQPNSTQFDFQKKITEPLQLLPGGYISILDLDAGIGWTSISADKQPVNTLMRGNVGSRRERRGMPRDQWVRSRR